MATVKVSCVCIACGIMLLRGSVAPAQQVGVSPKAAREVDDAVTGFVANRACAGIYATKLAGAHTSIVADAPSSSFVRTFEIIVSECPDKRVTRFDFNFNKIVEGIANRSPGWVSVFRIGSDSYEVRNGVLAKMRENERSVYPTFDPWCLCVAQYGDFLAGGVDSEFFLNMTRPDRRINAIAKAHACEGEWLVGHGLKSKCRVVFARDASMLPVKATWSAYTSRAVKAVDDRVEADFQFLSCVETKWRHIPLGLWVPQRIELFRSRGPVNAPVQTDQWEFQAEWRLGTDVPQSWFSSDTLVAPQEMLKLFSKL